MVKAIKEKIAKWCGVDGRRTYFIDIVTYVKIYLPDGNIEEIYCGSDYVTRIEVNRDTVSVYCRYDANESERLTTCYSGMPYRASYCEVERAW